MCRVIFMILRKNKSGGWKLRVSVERGSKLTKRVFELGLRTKDKELACERASFVMRAFVLAGEVKEEMLRISDIDTGRVLTYDDVIALDCSAPTSSMTQRTLKMCKQLERFGGLDKQMSLPLESSP